MDSEALGDGDNVPRSGGCTLFLSRRVLQGMDANLDMGRCTITSAKHGLDQHPLRQASMATYLCILRGRVQRVVTLGLGRETLAGAYSKGLGR